MEDTKRPVRACTVLILTRRPGETIRLGRDISLTILKSGPDRVRIAIRAPRDVAIDRSTR